MERISSLKLKRFVKHLCRVSSHYHTREIATQNLQEHLHTLKDPKLHNHISNVINSEIRVAGIGSKKKSHTSLIFRSKSNHERVHDIEKKVDNKYKQHQISEIKDKIKVLEENYSRISNDNTIHPARLHKFEQKIKEYKQKLKQL